MPQAENEDPDIKQHVNSLGEKLKTLRLRLRRCVSADRFFPSGLGSLFPLTPGEAQTAWREDSLKALEFCLLDRKSVCRERVCLYV